MHEISANFNVLVEQAPTTIESYLKRCIEMIDEAFGKGYAKNHPELLGTMIEACASDFNNASMLIASQRMADAIDDGAKRIADALVLAASEVLP